MSDSSQDYLLLAPGPVNLHPEVRRILSLPMIHHRTPQFDTILKRVLENLKYVFQTEQPVYMHASTGSGGMESLLVNVMHPNDEVLAIVSGKFGERWADMAKVFGGKVHTMNVPWGEAVDPEDVEKYLQANPSTRLVLTQACETSTAVTHPIQSLGKIISKYPETLFLVDGITAAGAFPLPMDQWHIDGLVAGSQKAFMLPTGMSFLAFSKKAYARVENNPTPRYYFDVRKEKSANGKGETMYSSVVPTIRALDFVLSEIKKESLNTHFARIHRRAVFTRHFANKIGLSVFAKSPSDSVTAINLPATVDSQKLRQTLEEDFQLTVMGGQDQLKGKILRFGHMGYIQDADLIRSMQNLAEALSKTDPDFAKSLNLAQLKIEMQTWLEQNHEEKNIDHG